MLAKDLRGEAIKEAVAAALAVSPGGGPVTPLPDGLVISWHNQFKPEMHDVPSSPPWNPGWASKVTGPAALPCGEDVLEVAPGHRSVRATRAGRCGRAREAAEGRAAARGSESVRADGGGSPSGRRSDEASPSPAPDVNRIALKNS